MVATENSRFTLQQTMADKYLNNKKSSLSNTFSNGLLRSAVTDSNQIYTKAHSTFLLIAHGRVRLLGTRKIEGSKKQCHDQTTELLH